MKYIKIFLASSIVEFKEEREDFGTFIRRLNNIYAKRNIYFDMFVCEDISKELSARRSQDRYNDEIKDSRYFYIIIGKNLGDRSLEEFDIALESFISTGFPLIMTYFYEIPEGGEKTKSVTDFMNRLETKLSHDYTDREDLDQKMVMINVLCGNILRELEQYSESENHFDRAVILADKLYGICPEAFEEDLARVNVGYAKLLVKTNRIEEANDRCSRAIDSYRKLIKISPQKYKKENLEANEVCNTANDSIKQHSPTGHHLLEWMSG